MNPHINKRGILNFRFLIGLGSVLFLIIVTAYFFYGLEPRAKGEEIDFWSTPINFKISKGEGLKEISAHLSQEKIIKSIGIFKFYSLLGGRAHKFQPGIYELKATMSIPQIVRVLTTTGQNEVTVTLTEGLTLKDFDFILSAAGVIEEGTLVNFSLNILSGDYPYLVEAKSFEGFLFPDTYRFEVSSSAETVLRRLLDNFNNKAWPLLKDKSNWYNTLILASFLEREVPGFNDRQLVAGLLEKRLKLGMPLQVDATVSYVKCGAKFLSCAVAPVAKKDLTLTSPYNTYQHLGFTPTPIANPGQSAISAALNPQASPYFYYLSAKNTKETIFAKTLEEHNRNRAKYL